MLTPVVWLYGKLCGSKNMTYIKITKENNAEVEEDKKRLEQTRFSTEVMLTCHSSKSTGVNNNLN